MLTHVFLIIHNIDVVRVLCEAMFLGDPSLAVISSSTHAGLRAVRSDTDGSSDSDDSHPVGEEADPTLSIAESLIDSSRAIRMARDAQPGGRLAAYMQYTCKPERYPVFRQPPDSLAVSLIKARNVTPALLQSVWPADMSPLRLINEADRHTGSLPISTGGTLRHTASLGDVSLMLDSLPLPASSDSALPRSLDRSRSASPFSSVSDQSPVQKHLFSVGSTPILHLPTAHYEVRIPDRTATREPENPIQLKGLPLLHTLLSSLEVGSGTDYEALFVLLLLSAVRANHGLDLPTLMLTGLAPPDSARCPAYDYSLVERLLNLIAVACKAGSRVRLITVHLAMRLLFDIVCDSQRRCYITDEHFAQLVGAREEAMMVLRSYFENDAIFLDLFEHELRELRQPFVPLQKLAVDSSLLVPPLAANALAGAHAKPNAIPKDYRRRLPQSHWEHTQRAVHVYLLVHIGLESLSRARPQGSAFGAPLSSSATGTTSVSSKTELPIFSPNIPIDLALVPGLAGLDTIPDPRPTAPPHKAGDKLDLSSEALIGCIVESGGSHEKRFLVNYSQQLVLVEPDSRQIGWGVITFIGPLQDIEAICDPADSRCLHVTINAPGRLTLASGSSALHAANYGRINRQNTGSSKPPLLTARFLFEDHIRCMTARQMLNRGRDLVRQTKLRKIAVMLDFSAQYLRENFSFTPTTHGLSGDVAYRPEQRFSMQGRFAPNRPFNDNTRSSIAHSLSRTNLGPDPSTFLMERQSRRMKQYRLVEDEPTEERVSPGLPNPGGQPRAMASATRKTPTCASFHLTDSTNLTPVTLVQQQLPVYRKPQARTTENSDSCNHPTGMHSMTPTSTNNDGLMK